MACFGCGGLMNCDERTIKQAKEQAQSTGEWVGLYRNTDGKLCIAGAGQTVDRWITPDMQ